MKLCQDLFQSFQANGERNAFVINRVEYTYNQLIQSIESIRQAIKTIVPVDEKNIGLIANDDIETYAAIIALLFEGKAYVPLSPDMPIERNQLVIDQAGIKWIIDSTQKPVFTSLNTISAKRLVKQTKLSEPLLVQDGEAAYILFTSGTTGIPKGVPITRANLSGFTDAFWKIGVEINEKDRVLQMFELTFDLSVMSYLIPLLKGACCYTIPKDKINICT